MPPAQPDSRGPDPLRQAAEVQGRGAAHDRQRRFSSPAARALAEIGYAEFDARRREAAARGLCRGIGQWRQADGAGAVRVRGSVSRRPDRFRSIPARWPWGRASRRPWRSCARRISAWRRRPSRCGRGHRVRQPWHGRIRQPPGHDGGIGGDAGGEPGARALRSAAALLGVGRTACCWPMARSRRRTVARSLARLATLWKGVPGYALPGQGDPGLDDTVHFHCDAQSYAGASHACEVEVDPGTGAVHLRYVAVHGAASSIRAGRRPGPRWRGARHRQRPVRVDGL